MTPMPSTKGTGWPRRVTTMIARPDPVLRFEAASAPGGETGRRDLLPPEAVAKQENIALPGATVTGMARGLAPSSAPRCDLWQRSATARCYADEGDVPVGAETDSIFGPLQTLRITRKGKPFASAKKRLPWPAARAETRFPSMAAALAWPRSPVEQVRGAPSTRPLNKALSNHSSATSMPKSWVNCQI